MPSGGTAAPHRIIIMLTNPGFNFRVYREILNPNIDIRALNFIFSSIGRA